MSNVKVSDYMVNNYIRLTTGSLPRPTLIERDSYGRIIGTMVYKDLIAKSVIVPHNAKNLNLELIVAASEPPLRYKRYKGGAADLDPRSKGVSGAGGGKQKYVTRQKQPIETRRDRLKKGDFSYTGSPNPEKQTEFNINISFAGIPKWVSMWDTVDLKASLDAHYNKLLIQAAKRRDRRQQNRRNFTLEAVLGLFNRTGASLNTRVLNSAVLAEEKKEVIEFKSLGAAAVNDFSNDNATAKIKELVFNYTGCSGLSGLFNTAYQPEQLAQQFLNSMLSRHFFNPNREKNGQDAAFLQSPIMILEAVLRVITNSNLVVPQADRIIGQQWQYSGQELPSAYPWFKNKDDEWEQHIPEIAEIPHVVTGISYLEMLKSKTEVIRPKNIKGQKEVDAIKEMAFIFTELFGIRSSSLAEHCAFTCFLVEKGQTVLTSEEVYDLVARSEFADKTKLSNIIAIPAGWALPRWERLSYSQSLSLLEFWKEMWSIFFNKEGWTCDCPLYFETIGDETTVTFGSSCKFVLNKYEAALILQNGTYCPFTKVALAAPTYHQSHKVSEVSVLSSHGQWIYWVLYECLANLSRGGTYLDTNLYKTLLFKERQGGSRTTYSEILEGAVSYASHNAISDNALLNERSIAIEESAWSRAVSRHSVVVSTYRSPGHVLFEYKDLPMMLRSNPENRFGAMLSAGVGSMYTKNSNKISGNMKRVQAHCSLKPTGSNTYVPYTNVADVLLNKYNSLILPYGNMNSVELRAVACYVEALPLAKKKAYVADIARVMDAGKLDESLRDRYASLWAEYSAEDALRIAAFVEKASLEEVSGLEVNSDAWRNAITAVVMDSTKVSKAAKRCTSGFGGQVLITTAQPEKGTFVKELAYKPMHKDADLLDQAHAEIINAILMPQQPMAPGMAYFLNGPDLKGYKPYTEWAQAGQVYKFFAPEGKNLRDIADLVEVLVDEDCFTDLLDDEMVLSFDKEPILEKQIPFIQLDLNISRKLYAPYRCKLVSISFKLVTAYNQHILEVVPTFRKYTTSIKDRGCGIKAMMACSKGVEFKLDPNYLELAQHHAYYPMDTLKFLDNICGFAPFAAESLSSESDGSKGRQLLVAANKLVGKDSDKFWHWSKLYVGSEEYQAINNYFVQKHGSYVWTHFTDESMVEQAKRYYHDVCCADSSNAHPDAGTMRLMTLGEYELPAGIPVHAVTMTHVDDSDFPALVSYWEGNVAFCTWAYVNVPKPIMTEYTTVIESVGTGMISTACMLDIEAQGMTDLAAEMVELGHTRGDLKYRMLNTMRATANSAIEVDGNLLDTLNLLYSSVEETFRQDNAEQLAKLLEVANISRTLFIQECAEFFGNRLIKVPCSTLGLTNNNGCNDIAPAVNIFLPYVMGFGIDDLDQDKVSISHKVTDWLEAWIAGGLANSDELMIIARDLSNMVGGLINNEHTIKSIVGGPKSVNFKWIATPEVPFGELWLVENDLVHQAYVHAFGKVKEQEISVGFRSPIRSHFAAKVRVLTTKENEALDYPLPEGVAAVNSMMCYFTYGDFDGDGVMITNEDGCATHAYRLGELKLSTYERMLKFLAETAIGADMMSLDYTGSLDYYADHFAFPSYEKIKAKMGISLKKSIHSRKSATEFVTAALATQTLGVSGSYRASLFASLIIPVIKALGTNVLPSLEGIADDAGLTYRLEQLYEKLLGGYDEQVAYAVFGALLRGQNLQTAVDDFYVIDEVRDAIHAGESADTANKLVPGINKNHTQITQAALEESLDKLGFVGARDAKPFLDCYVLSGIGLKMQFASNLKSTERTLDLLMRVTQYLYTVIAGSPEEKLKDSFNCFKSQWVEGWLEFTTKTISGKLLDNFENTLAKISKPVISFTAEEFKLMTRVSAKELEQHRSVIISESAVQVCHENKWYSWPVKASLPITLEGEEVVCTGANAQTSRKGQVVDSNDWYMAYEFDRDGNDQPLGYSALVYDLHVDDMPKLEELLTEDEVALILQDFAKVAFVIKGIKPQPIEVAIPTADETAPEEVELSEEDVLSEFQKSELVDYTQEQLIAAYNSQKAGFTYSGKWIQNWFSNMMQLENPIVWNGVQYWTIENFYQAMKTEDVEQQKLIANLSAHKSKSYGRTVVLRPDWEDYKLKVMWFALNHKFAPGTEAASRLINTNPTLIVEWNNWQDIFWGVDVSPLNGQNILGRMLMTLRNKLKTKSAQDDWIDLNETQEEELSSQKSESKSNVTAGFKLTEQQEAAFKVITDWAKSKTSVDITKNIFVLKGYAGTGKTTLTPQFIKVLTPFYSVVVCAPTHKAANVIKTKLAAAEVSCDVSTIDSLLKIKPQYDNATGHRQFRPSVSLDQLNLPDFIIVDEASMIDPLRLDYLLQAAAMGKKILFVGDPAQLPFVPNANGYKGLKIPFEISKQSPVFIHPLIQNQFELTDVVRYEGDLAKLAFQLRSQNQFHLQTSDDHSLEAYAQDAWLKILLDKFLSVEFEQDPDYVRAIAFTNIRVAEINKAVRQARYGNNPKRFENGELLIAKKPATLENGQHLNISDEVVVRSERIGFDDNQIKCRFLIVDMNNCPLADEIKIVHEDAEAQLNAELEKLKTRAIQLRSRGAWVSYYKLKEQYASLEYGYALTIHKSQGSTFQYVGVDEENINTYCRNDLEMGRALKYTAITWASKQVFVTHQKVAKKTEQMQVTSISKPVVPQEKPTYEIYKSDQDELEPIENDSYAGTCLQTSTIWYTKPVS